MMGRLLRIGVFSLTLGSASILALELGRAQPSNIPSDFNIRIVSSSRGPPRTPPDIQYAEIKASGEAILSEMPAESGDLPAATIKISSEALARIYKAVVEQRFFELQPLYRDPEIVDGDQAETTVTAAGQTHSVRTVNITVFAFDRVTIAVDRELPIERRIQYNALHDSSYKRIER